MDKDLHKNIGESFRDEINSMSQQPRENVWENIDKALDKTDAKNYKDKFARLKKRTILLLLLLIGISTFSVIYFNTSKNKNNNYSSSEQKTKESNNNYKIDNYIISKQDTREKNNITQKQIVNDKTSADNAVQNKREEIFISGKFSIIKKGKIVSKITNGNLTEEEFVANNEIKISKNNPPEKSADTSILKVVTKTDDAEKTLTPIPLVLKNDSVPLKAENQFVKSANKKQRKNNAKFTLTAFAAPDYSEYHLVNDKHNNYDNKAGIATRENSDLSSSVGILLGYKTANKIIIQSGIIYSSTNISIDPTKIYAETDNAGVIKFRYNTSSGYSYLLPSFNSSPALGDSLFANGANHTLHYISIPIIAKYKLGNKKITFNPGVGFTFNFLTKATLTTDVEDRSNRETEYITKLESIKKFGCSLILTPEVQYQLSKNWSITTVPYFKYSLGAIDKGNVVKTYPYTFGLGIGVVYKF